MAVLNVIANMHGQGYELSESTENKYSTNLVAPQETAEVIVLATDDNGNTSAVAQELTVESEWLAPKTDWTAEDYINYADYNRIINNLKHLRNLAKTLFIEISNTDLTEKEGYSSFIFAKDINAIENTLENLNSKTYGFKIGDTVEYFANQRTISYEELNRIESAILLLKKTMDAHKMSLRKLAFRLGNQKGIKV